MTLILLPPETIARVLHYLEPEDLKFTRRVCRYPGEIIAHTLYLQYVLELDKSGCAAPQLIRKDLEYGKMIQAIWNHRSRWQHVELGGPKAIEVPDNMHVLLPVNCLSDNVYALLFEAVTSDGSNKSSICFHQLPSFYKGMDYRHWVHNNLGFCASALAIQPEIDLMVILE
ncbi:hypothetical protein OPQ81_002125 [Rhizoctonia solani]|nr:hypothetical protein OPQ81_002125 [Rhizoctonia solani]